MTRLTALALDVGVTSDIICSATSTFGNVILNKKRVLEELLAASQCHQS